jgi:hypothetical protein
MTAEQPKSRAMFASRASSSQQLARSCIAGELIMIAFSGARQSLIVRLEGLGTGVRNLPSIEQASEFSRFSSRLIAVPSLAIGFSLHTHAVDDKSAGLPGMPVRASVNAAT